MNIILRFKTFKIRSTDNSFPLPDQFFSSPHYYYYYISSFFSSYFNFIRRSAVLSFCFMRNNASPLNLIVSDEWFSIHCVKTMDYFIVFVSLSANAARIRFKLNPFHEKRIKTKLFLILLCCFFFLLFLQLKIGFELPNKLKSIRLTTRRD